MRAERSPLFSWLMAFRSSYAVGYTLTYTPEIDTWISCSNFRSAAPHGARIFPFFILELRSHYHPVKPCQAKLGGILLSTHTLRSEVRPGVWLRAQRSEKHTLPCASIQRPPGLARWV